MFNEAVWREGEKLAQEYMLSHGYRLLYTNFQCVGIELDIVAILPAKVQKQNLKEELKKRILDEKNPKMRAYFKQNYKNLSKNLTDLLVVTEVKARSSANFGIGAEAVDSAKIYNIKKGADYLLQKQEFAGMQVRFDIASVDENKVTYLENAFE